MIQGLGNELDKLLATLCRFFADEGMAKEVAMLADARASIEQTDYDNWNNGICGYTIYLILPEALYQQLGSLADVEKIEERFRERSSDLSRMYANEYIRDFKILTELHSDPDWRQMVKAYAAGQGLTNQGRARSGNVAPRTADGLLFR